MLLSPFFLFLYRHLPTSVGVGNLRIAGKISDVTRIVTYLPREGTETLSRPRSRQAKHEYQILFNSKGAGNAFNAGTVAANTSLSIAPYLPREGPEKHLLRS